MPLVSTWIKNEDWDAYYQLASKKQWGEFIHSALNSRKRIEMVMVKDASALKNYRVADGGYGGVPYQEKPIKTPLKRDDPEWEGPILKKGKR